MSVSIASPGRVPTQQRGRARVAAILAAAASLFEEKGYDGVTMSDVAARSGTAFGSLYRFFPSKDVLAEALLRGYGEAALAALEALRDGPRLASVSALVEALLAYKFSLSRFRPSVMALVDSRRIPEQRMAEFRERQRALLAAVVRTVIPTLGPAAAKAVATTVLHLLAGISAAAEAKATPDRVLVAERRRALDAYLRAVRSEAGKP